MNDVIEFYNKRKLVCRVKSSIIPMAGSAINIQKKTWIVSHVEFCVDYADDREMCGMRVNIDICDPLEAPSPAKHARTAVRTGTLSGFQKKQKIEQGARNAIAENGGRATTAQIMAASDLDLSEFGRTPPLAFISSILSRSPAFINKRSVGWMLAPEQATT